MDDRDDILAIALDWARQGCGVALATVVETWGSAPRRAGSQMAIEAGGRFVGSVSGGCVEGAVLTEAAETLADGRARLLEFGVSNDQAWAVGLACGGRIRVLVEPVAPDGATGGDGPHGLAVELLAQLLQARAERRPVVVAGALDGAATRLIFPGAADPLRAAAEAALADGHPRTVSVEGRELFLNPFAPALRLVVIGAVHIAEPLVRMAAILGHSIHVVDPREVFARADRFADAALIVGWPDVVLPDLGLDAHSAVVALTHDPKIDDRALIAALAAPCCYVGALGSLRTHAARLGRLRASGVCEADLARIHAPIGLDIGAETPAEIALAILAELTARLRGVVL